MDCLPVRLSTLVEPPLLPLLSAAAPSLTAPVAMMETSARELLLASKDSASTKMARGLKV